MASHRSFLRPALPTGPVPQAVQSHRLPPPSSGRAADDDCEVADSSFPTPETSARHLFRPSHMTPEAIENEIRAARQVISDSTTQRNVVLQFLLHLQTAQRELANEAELVTRQLPALRVHLSESGPWDTDQPTTDERAGSSTSITPLQVSVLSRLTRLSQRTRQVIEDLDRRRNAVGMASLQHSGRSRNRDSEIQKVDSDAPDRVQLLKPLRKVSLEERLLVEWSPHGISRPSPRIPCQRSSRKVLTRPHDRELVSR